MEKKKPYFRIKILFLFSILALLVLSFFTYLRVQNLIEESKLVNHAQIVKLELEKITAAILDAELYQKNYFLTDNAAMLTIRDSAFERLSSVLDKVDSLTMNDPIQINNLKNLHNAIDLKLESMKKVLVLYTPGVSTTSQFSVNLNEGIQLTKNMLEKINILQSEEDRLLKVRTAALKKLEFITPLLSIMLIFCSIAILFVAYFKIIQQLYISNDLRLNLQHKNEELQKSNNELESFNYISSHDLQEPLRKIQIYYSRIVDIEHNLSEKGKYYFEKINDSASRMRNLIEDLLAYSRAKVPERNFEMTDLNKIVKNVIEDFKETVVEKNAIIEVGELCDAYVIPFQFHQLMYNIIGNSLKFAKLGVPPHITINNRITKDPGINNENKITKKDYCHITITDNGMGFDPQYQERIFKVFQRVVDDPKIDGTGMGLAIAKIIVENHKGIITATGELNKGATFDIYIPVI